MQSISRIRFLWSRSLKCLRPPYVGHIGLYKTLNCLMNDFYWLGICMDVQKFHCAHYPYSRSPLNKLARILSRLTCVSSGGLCNVISGSSASTQHLSRQCCGGSLHCYFLCRDPKRDPDWPGHYVHIMDTLQKLLGIKSMCTSICHPQMDWLVDWFTEMLKNMIVCSLWCMKLE